jgi:putative membrane protein
VQIFFCLGLFPLFRLAVFFGLLGLAAVTGILVWSGIDPILAALRVAGWGIVWTSAYHVLPLLACCLGWQALMPGRKKPSIWFFLYILWMRGAVNNLMPVARVGGELVSVRAMMKHGMRKSYAVASTIVELTLSITAVFLFILSGILLLSLRIDDHDLGLKLAAGLMASMPLIAALGIIQRIGFFGLLNKIFVLILRDRWTKFAGDARMLDRAIHAMYRRKRRIAICFFWQLVSWSSCAGEIWLALHFLQHPLPLLDCLIIEALIQGTSSAAFAVPGALGVQEAGFLFFGNLLGLPADIAIAMAVIRRCRDLILYLPGLVAWQVQEGRWLLGRRTAR